MSSLLVTGANRGIGLEFCRQYAVDGWNVIACARGLDQAADLLGLARQHASISLHPLDVTDYAQLAELSAELEDRAIDILINNAALFGPRSVFPTVAELAGWRQTLEVNTIAPMMVASAFIPHLARSELKLIANLSSRVGSVADNSSGSNTPYRSSKAALNQVNKNLAINLAAKGITAIVLHPGWVQTTMGGPNALISTAQSVDGMR